MIFSKGRSFQSNLLSFFEKITDFKTKEIQKIYSTWISVRDLIQFHVGNY